MKFKNFSEILTKKIKNNQIPFTSNLSFALEKENLILVFSLGESSLNDLYIIKNNLILQNKKILGWLLI